MFFGYTWFPFYTLKGLIPVLSIGMIGVSYTIGLIEQYVLVTMLRRKRERIREKTLEKLSPVFSSGSAKEDMLLTVMSESPQSYKYLNQLHNQCRLLVATTANVLLVLPIFILYLFRIRFNVYLSVFFVLVFIAFAYFLSHTSKVFYIYFTKRAGLIYMRVKGKGGENLTGGENHAQKRKW